jgi:hypothetical protein
VYVHDTLDQAEKAEKLSTHEEARRQHSYLERKNAYLATKKVTADRDKAQEASKGRLQNTVLLRDLADLQRRSTLDKQVGRPSCSQSSFSWFEKVSADPWRFSLRR